VVPTLRSAKHLKTTWRRHRTGRALAQAEALLREGRGLDAIDALARTNRARPDVAIERRLVLLRQEAFEELRPSSGQSMPSHSATTDLAATNGGVDTRTRVAGIPEVTPSDLTAERVRQAVLEHGSIVVRGMLGARHTQWLAEAITAAIGAQERYYERGKSAEEASPWFAPVVVPPGHERPSAEMRRWVRDGGGVMAADSPRGLFRLTEVLRATGLTEVVHDYLGERPVLSIRKTTLRSVSPQTNSAWHQDGAFLGEGVRALNIWIALTDCGDDAPTLDVVPKRLGSIVPTGTDGTPFEWSVADAVTTRTAADDQPVRLHFRAGDAILFDEMNLHRTGVGPGMTKHRLAIEAWSFAPSSYPMDQLPVVL
jgi:hypothetical protein